MATVAPALSPSTLVARAARVRPLLWQTWLVPVAAAPSPWSAMADPSKPVPDGSYYQGLPFPSSLAHASSSCALGPLILASDACCFTHIVWQLIQFSSVYWPQSFRAPLSAPLQDIFLWQDSSSCPQGRSRPWLSLIPWCWLLPVLASCFLAILKWQMGSPAWWGCCLPRWSSSQAAVELAFADGSRVFTRSNSEIRIPDFSGE